MKRIIKKAPPARYQEWLAREGNEVRYDGNSDVIRIHCLDSLISEQKGICCYSGISIVDRNAHIEHLFPQSRSLANGTHEDVDYANMMACYPKTGKCDFGGMKKANEQIEVTPFDTDCETRFTFTLEGKIKTERQNDGAAERTIATLALDDRTLTSRRRTVIVQRLESRRLSNAQILELKAQMRLPNSDGNYVPFCFVIEKACDAALKNRAKRAKIIQHSARTRRQTRR